MASLDITSLLEQAGVRQIREGQKEVTALCPMHKERVGKEDSHASWSINRHTFVHHCFSCGYSGTLVSLLVDLQGYAPEDIQTEIAKSSFLRTMEKITKRDEEPEERPPTEWELSNILTPVPDRLLTLRQLQRNAVDVYGIRWDPERKSWVLPIRHPDGTLMGVQYRQKGVVLNAPKGMNKAITLFGYNEMMLRSDVWVTLVESPLDAVRLYGLGIPALASFGAWVSDEQVTLLCRNFRRIMLAMDNDKVGRQATDMLRMQFRKRNQPHAVFRYDGLTTADGGIAKDLGDVALDEDILTAYQRSKEVL